MISLSDSLSADEVLVMKMPEGIAKPFLIQ